MQPESRPRIQNFTDLIAWQEGHQLVLMIYRQLKLLPNSEKFNLIDQLQRATVSITSNIAEGFNRQTTKEKVQFLYIALGSTKEVENQLLICRDLKYMSEEQYLATLDQVTKVGKLLNGLIKALNAHK